MSSVPTIRRSLASAPGCLVLLLACGVTQSLPAQSSPGDYAQQIQPLLKRYCFECHGGGASEGDLALDAFQSPEQAAAQPDKWWRVLKNLRAGIMPPVGEPQPSVDELQQLTDWIKFQVFRIRADDLDPGAAAVRRLNRTEYGNTIADLMGVPFRAELLFPPEDSGHGFDNVGDALSFSPLLLEKYLQAAQVVVDQAVPRETWTLPRREWSGRDFKANGGESRGGTLDGKRPVRVQRSILVEESGVYSVAVEVRLHGSFDFDPARYVVSFSIDGSERSRNEYGWDENKPVRSQYQEPWQTGEHQLAFELTPLPGKSHDDLSGLADGGDPTGVRFEIQSVRIEGPSGTDRRVHPPNYERFFPRAAPPDSAIERREYAGEVLRQFATRAYRGPVDERSLERLIAIAERGLSQPGITFEAGVAQAMIPVLASPRFLFRIENVLPAAAHREFGSIDDWSLASRLSYFLWSTMPDEELFERAKTGTLRPQLSQQLKRMMNDPRAEEFVSNFVGQWLRTRDVTQVSVDPIAVLGHQAEYEALLAQFRTRFRRRGEGELTPEEQKRRDRFRELRAISERFDADLKRAMRRETEMSVEYLVREDRDLLDLIDCNYVFINEPLAELYGISGVRGKELRRVELPAGSARGGVLTQASMLLVTSNPTRTSPVKRGLFILDNLLGTPAPPPPAAVPDLEASAQRFAGKQPTLRELLAVHRESPLCASCHARMDPLGLALENFNALGMWQAEEHGQPIDPGGQLLTGESFRDVIELKRILRENYAGRFYRCVTEKLLTYALGRGLNYTDQHTVDLIVGDLQQQGGKFSVLLRGVVESAPFQKQRLATGRPATPAQETRP